jgi:hypothetical protein
MTIYDSESGLIVRKECVMTGAAASIDGWIEVTNSFYITFDGRRCYCSVPELFITHNAAQMLVKYKQGDEESYHLVSNDGARFTGTIGTDDDSRVNFVKWECKNHLVLAGSWKCGGREGEWYIEGITGKIEH